VVAVAGLGDQLGPPLVAVTGPVHDLGQHPRQDLADADRLGHFGLPCVWLATEVGMVVVEDRQCGEQV
jgi:hypothetical protein